MSTITPEMNDLKITEEEALQDAKHLLNSDRNLTPGMIHSLLNVDVAEQHDVVVHTNMRHDAMMRIVMTFMTVAVSIVLALGVGAWLMHAHEIGPFADGLNASLQRSQ